MSCWSIVRCSAQGWHGNSGTDEYAPALILARQAADSLSVLMAAVSAHPARCGQPAAGLLAMLPESVWAAFGLTGGRGTGFTPDHAACSEGRTRWC
jgi:hypothetical protein